MPLEDPLQDPLQDFAFSLEILSSHGNLRSKLLSLDHQQNLNIEL